jgi:hypothetical protein
MTATILGITAAYVVMSILFLAASLSAPLKWWIKAAAIVVSSFFFAEIFFATKGLLGWPGTDKLPAHFQLLWASVVEPDPKLRDPGHIYLWVEEFDANHVPTGVPRSYGLAYDSKLAQQIQSAQEELRQGEELEGTAEDMGGSQNATEARTGGELPNNMDPTNNGQVGANNLDLSVLEGAQQEQNIRFAPLQLPPLPCKLGDPSCRQ